MCLKLSRYFTPSLLCGDQFSQSFLELIRFRISVDHLWTYTVFLALMFWISKLSTMYRFKACPILKIPVKLAHITTSQNLLSTPQCETYLQIYLASHSSAQPPSLFIPPHFSVNPIKTVQSHFTSSVICYTYLQGGR